MQNFDCSKNSYSISSEENLYQKSIQLEDGRVRILAEKNHKKIYYYIDSNHQDHKTPIEYMQKDISNNLVIIDPYLHFNLPFNFIKPSLLVDDLLALNQFMTEYLLTNLKSSKSYKEKARDIS